MEFSTIAFYCVCLDISIFYLLHEYIYIWIYFYRIITDTQWGANQQPRVSKWFMVKRYEQMWQLWGCVSVLIRCYLDVIRFFRWTWRWYLYRCCLKSVGLQVFYDLESEEVATNWWGWTMGPCNSYEISIIIRSKVPFIEINMEFPMDVCW